MKKLILADAGIDYTGCYYEGDAPGFNFDVKEVTLDEAINCFIDDNDIDNNETIEKVFSYIFPRGKSNKRSKEIRLALAKFGYVQENKNREK